MSSSRPASALKIRAAKIVTGHAAGQLIGPATRYRIRHQGLPFDVRSADFSPRVRAQMFWGAYEGAETRMIRSVLPGSTTVVELGSSLGVTTAHIAAAMAPGGHLVCVEANPQLIPGLTARVGERTAALRVDVIHAAVTGHCGTATLTVTEQTTGSSLSGSRRGGPGVQVPALTLREVLRRAAVGEYSLVSDIEGAESSFLLTDPGALGNCRSAVLELHDTVVGGQDVTVADLMDAAVSAGFTVLRQHGPVVALARR
jgi:FkbM family methyltransferase